MLKWISCPSPNYMHKQIKIQTNYYKCVHIREIMEITRVPLGGFESPELELLLELLSWEESCDWALKLNFPLKIFLLGKLRKEEEEEEEKIRLLRVDTITNEEECDTEEGFIVNDDIGISSENMSIFSLC